MKNQLIISQVVDNLAVDLKPLAIKRSFLVVALAARGTLAATYASGGTFAGPEGTCLVASFGYPSTDGPCSCC